MKLHNYHACLCVFNQNLFNNRLLKYEIIYIKKTNTIVFILLFEISVKFTCLCRTETLKKKNHTSFLSILHTLGKKKSSILLQITFLLPKAESYTGRKVSATGQPHLVPGSCTGFHNKSQLKRMTSKNASKI